MNEGDRVTRGQFLLQIDPKSLRTRVDSGNASLQAAESSLDQVRFSTGVSRGRARTRIRPTSCAATSAVYSDSSPHWRVARLKITVQSRAPGMV